jgi:hypothetical protein
MGDVLKYCHVIDLAFYIRFYVHRSRKSISSIVLYPTRGNGGSDLPPFGFKYRNDGKMGAKFRNDGEYVGEVFWVG